MNKKLLILLLLLIVAGTLLLNTKDKISDDAAENQQKVEKNIPIQEPRKDGEMKEALPTTTGITLVVSTPDTNNTGCVLETYEDTLSNGDVFRFDTFNCGGEKFEKRGEIYICEGGMGQIKIFQDDGVGEFSVQSILQPYPSCLIAREDADTVRLLTATGSTQTCGQQLGLPYESGQLIVGAYLGIGYLIVEGIPVGDVGCFNGAKEIIQK